MVGRVDLLKELNVYEHTKLFGSKFQILMTLGKKNN